MKPIEKHFAAKKVITYEVIATLLIIILLWLDEIIDIPYLLLGAEATPVNWRESVFESLAIAVVGGVIIVFTNKVFQRMRYLEGILPVCAACKKIRDEKGDWQQIEAYIRDRSAARFSHGICPECARKIYPEFQGER
jgi:hypothetical protein